MANGTYFKENGIWKPAGWPRRKRMDNLDQIDQSAAEIERFGDGRHWKFPRRWQYPKWVMFRGRKCYLA